MIKMPRQMKGMILSEIQAAAPCECEHDFVLVLTDIGDLTLEAVNALLDAGRDDATIRVRSGVSS
jgi:hypothetical protein